MGPQTLFVRRPVHNEVIFCYVETKKRRMFWGIKWSASDGAYLVSGSDTFLSVFQGLDRRKNKFPVGGVIVVLFVPLLVGQHHYA
jgi:hypothetical protein